MSALTLLLVWFATSAASAATPIRWELVRDYPHRSDGFTQGLVVDGDSLLESSGGYGGSFIVRWQLDGDRRAQRLNLPRRYFAEGLTRLDDRLYLLTWREQRGFVFNADSFEQLATFAYKGEGWGLTHNRTHLIMSDGSATLRWLDPVDFRVTRRLQVSEAGAPVDKLNALQWIPAGTALTPHGARLLANRWLTDTIVVIDPASGQVTGELRLASLYPPAERRPQADVLNGVAWDAADDSLLVTGKRWPRLYRLALPEGMP